MLVELVSDSEVLQQFMLYPERKTKRNYTDTKWVIEMIEPELIQRRNGYGNLEVEYETVYQLLADNGIDERFLQNLLASK